MKTNLFTPIVAGKRRRFKISDADSAKLTRGKLGTMGVVTDLKSGKRYRVEGRECSLSCCCCDAEAFLIKGAKL